MSSSLYNDFLTLVKLGGGTLEEARVSLMVDWPSIKALAERQGLAAVVLDGINRLSKATRPSGIFLLEWIGEVAQDYEQRYELYSKVLGEMAAFYNSHDFKMMVLKGYACCQDWPQPNHRPCGDIDIWQFGQYIEADEVLKKEKGIEVDTSHHHHTVFHWGGFMVENHYDFINVHHHKSNVEFEAILKDFAKDDSYSVDVNGQKVYLPSPNLHALFLLKHLMMHFAAEGIKLRQLLDWAFFVKVHSTNVTWDWVDDILERFGMKPLYGIFNAICVEDLGFDSRLFSNVQFEPVLKNKVLDDILSPMFKVKLPKRLIPRLMFKIHRWKASRWKHELCYKESMWSAFWSGVWSHLLKPSSI